MLSIAIEEKRKQEGQWEKASCDAGSTNPRDALEYEWPFPGCPRLLYTLAFISPCRGGTPGKGLTSGNALPCSCSNATGADS